MTAGGAGAFRTAPVGAMSGVGNVGRSPSGVGTDGGSTPTVTPPEPTPTVRPGRSIEVPAVGTVGRTATGGSATATGIGVDGSPERIDGTRIPAAGAGDSAAPAAAAPRIRTIPVPPRTTSIRSAIDAQRRGVTRSRSPRGALVPPRRVVETPIFFRGARRPTQAVNQEIAPSATRAAPATIANHEASTRRCRITHVVACVTRWRARSERVVTSIRASGMPLAKSV